MRTTQGGLVARFDDPAAFAASIQNAHARVLPQSAGAYEARMALVRLGGINLVAMRESLPRRYQCDLAPTRVYVRLQVPHDPPSIRGGEDEPPGTLHINPHGARVDEYTPGPAVVRNLSIAYEDFAVRAEALLDRSLPGLLGERGRVRPAPGHFAELVALHRDAARLAVHDPAMLTHPLAAAALDARLGEALLAMLAGTAPRHETAATRRGHAIMRRVLEFLDGHEAQPITLTQLCTVARCSAKRLELLFHETFGQTPMRYLRQRRLWLARRSLLAADPRTATVARVAMECGFWELGRFAAAYRREFGELPSQTLRAADRAMVEAPVAA